MNHEGTKNANHDGTKYANPNPESPIPNPPIPNLDCLSGCIFVVTKFALGLAHTIALHLLFMFFAVMTEACRELLSQK